MASNHMDTERNASTAGRSKSIVSLTALDGLDEYAALQRYILLYRDKKPSDDAAQANAADAKKGKQWWQFWRSGSSPAAVAGSDPGAVPEDMLDTTLNPGLSHHEVETRRKRYGWNELTTEKTNWLKQFLSYFQGPILYVMEIAALLAAGLGDWIDFGVICGILLLNATVGWYQEKQAADVVASLKGDIAMKATVVRDGGEVQILAREIVPGDIVVVEEGSTVPADVRLICAYDAPEDFELYLKMKEEDKFDDASDPDDEKKEDDMGEEERPISQGHSLIATDQSAITGESLAVDKYMGEVAYYTTGCKRGKCYGIALCSARTSFVGRTASLVQGAKDQGMFSPSQLRPPPAIYDEIGALTSSQVISRQS
jgi:H+-transporting ATPase